MNDCKINILGTEYSIKIVDKYPEYLSEFEETADALCNSYDRTIFIKNDIEKDTTDNGKERKNKKNLRHEIYHAFMYESGLSSNTYGHMGAWAEHEEMIDWHAIMAPKVFKVFQELDLL